MSERLNPEAWSTPESAIAAIEERFRELRRNNPIVAVAMKAHEDGLISEVIALKNAILLFDEAYKNVLKIATRWGLSEPILRTRDPIEQTSSAAAPGVSFPPSTAAASEP